MAQHKATVEAVRMKYLDESQHVLILRTIGYKLRCSCGEVGGLRREWATARVDRIAHLQATAPAANIGG